MSAAAYSSLNLIGPSSSSSLLEELGIDAAAVGGEDLDPQPVASPAPCLEEPTPLAGGSGEGS